MRVPVTAKLSRLFYERLGEQVANELVDWFNLVDATYRADLRELNELNFARFDAKVEQRFAAQDARLERRLAAMEVRLERRFAELDAKIDRVAAEAAARDDKLVADLHALLERRLGEQTRWLVLSWLSLMIPLLGLWMRG
jgi:CRP-like cAMP-binding protein